MLQVALLAFALGGAPFQEKAVAPPAEATCKQPEIRERMTVVAEDMAIFTQRVQDYINCMEPRIDAKRKNAEKMLNEARAVAEASNADVTALNEYLAKVKAFQFKHKDDK